MNRFYEGSDYQMNRKSSSIVYTSTVPGGTVTITLEMFLDENPTLTEADFHRWKKWSDNSFEGLYHNDRKQGRRHLPLREELDQRFFDLSDGAWMEAVENRQELYAAIQKNLTGKQRRRLLAHHFHGLTCTEIAEMEGVTSQVISRSIVKARKKLENIFEKGFKTPSGKAYI